VFLSNIEQVAVPAVGRALSGGQVVLVDEIGKMELMSRSFRDIIRQALDSERTLVATLSISKDRFSESIRGRPDVNLLEVTRVNREEMAARIVSLIDARL
jgi:nucleoside-triphosphatase